MQIDACVKLHIVSTQKENPRAGPRYTQLAKVYPSPFTHPAGRAERGWVGKGMRVGGWVAGMPPCT